MELNQKLLDAIYQCFYSTTLDGYLLKNHQEIYHLIELTNSYLPYKKPVPFQKHFSKKTTIALERKFLSSLSAKYKKQFNRDNRRHHIISQKIDHGNYYLDPSKNEYQIRYPKTGYMRDFLILTHEYIHHLSFQFPNLQKESSGYRIYCEMLSLLGELKALDFLLESGIQEQEIETYKLNRLYESNAELQVILLIEPLFSIFLSGGSLTENTINELLETNPYYKALGKKNVTYNLVWVLNNNFNKWYSSYVYPLGLTWASSLHQDNISNEDFVTLMEVVNTVEVTEFEKFLPTKSPIELATAAGKEFSLKKGKK